MLSEAFFPSVYIEKGLKFGILRYQRSLLMNSGHRFAPSERTRIKSSRLDLQPGFTFEHLFDHGQHYIPQFVIEWGSVHFYVRWTKYSLRESPRRRP